MRNLKVIIFLIIALLSASYLAYISEYIVAGVIFILSIILFFIPINDYKTEDNDSQLLDQIDSLLMDCAEGKLTGRIELDKNETKVERVGWHLNNVLDQMEVILRERVNIQYRRLVVVTMIECYFQVVYMESLRRV